ncbi:hypothetical protein SAMN06265361_103186 [Laceyella tengchongensis]|uniref:Uncharacterized protein n=1 Tax=Laceyella tengchongensis TaxID=574699 RepID=A0AA45WNM6_9BACL|nr:hypothetical protein [Laceyella tengchongensis]SMP18719.1 hypothetical protein SAMN06265361_103186 [Laceyella tengchongensis]
MHKTWLNIAAFISIAVAAFFIGIQFFDTDPQVIRVHGSLHAAYNLEEMKNQSEVIVVGKFVKMERKINSARDLNNPGLASNTVYHEGELYQFKADQIIKGAISQESIIRVNIPKTKELANLDSQDKLSVTDPNYIKPEFGKSYMLFLTPIKNTDYYGIPFFPYILEIHNNQTVSLVKPHPSLLSQRSMIQDAVEGKREEVLVHFENFATSYPDQISGRKLSEVLSALGGSPTE